MRARGRQLATTLVAIGVTYTASLFVEVHGSRGPVSIIGIGHGMVGGQYTPGGLQQTSVAARLLTPWHELPHLWPTWEFRGPYQHIVVPLWIPAAIAAFAAVLRWHHRRPGAPGRCTTCGYDVRGLKTPLCPECGAEVVG